MLGEHRQQVATFPGAQADDARRAGGAVEGFVQTALYDGKAP